MYQYSDYQYFKKYSLIKNILLNNKISVVKPIAYILGGQPGAGKTILQNSILKSNKNCIVINADAFREFHPYFSEIQAAFGDEAPKYTQPFINRITEQLIRELSDEKYNLIIEGTLRTAETPINTCKTLKDKGYRVELHIIAVKKEISYESTILRYEIAIASGKTPRATAKEHHDLVAESIVKNLDLIYQRKIFDDIRLFSRFEKCIYPTGEEISPAIVEHEVLNGNWSNAELSMLREIVSEVKRLKSERNAPDYESYSLRTDELTDSISVSDFYLEVTKQEAAYLTEQGVRYDGNISEEKNSIIKISKSEKDKVNDMLELFRKKNNIKK